MKYPFIGGIDDDCKVLLIENGYGIAIEHPTIEITGVPERGWDNRSFKNITPEYLANTYGKVESKEHAEFIIGLCKIGGIEIFNEFESGITHFIIAKCELIFTYGVPTTSAHDRLITIPLPPKQIQTATSEGNEMSEFKVNINNNTENLVRVTESEDKKTVSISVDKAPTDNLKNNGDNLVLGCGDSKCEEWPQIGDEVAAYDIGFEREMTVIYRGKNKNNARIVELENGNVILLGFEGKIKKPKTPDEELFENFWREVGLFMNQSNLNKDIFKAAFIKNITKKPQ